jgi:hypothetical protein
MRYLHQPLPVLLGLTLRQLDELYEVTGSIVEEENKPGK